MASVKSKILILDVETAFKIAGVWGMYDQNVAMNQLLQDTHILCWAAKWLDDKYIYYDSLHRHKAAYKKDPTNDRLILENLWELLDEADYVVAHNGLKFDKRVINARLIANGMKPPSPYRVIDTLLVARRHFKFTSNRLDDLGKLLGYGGKKAHEGFDLWKKVVIQRDRKAFDRMVAYCERDVELLEDVYKELRSWDSNHPSVHSDFQCSVCGGRHLTKQGLYRSVTQTYQRYKCQDCGTWSRSTKAEKKDKNSNSVRSI